MREAVLELTVAELELLETMTRCLVGDIRNKRQKVAEATEREWHEVDLLELSCVEVPFATDLHRMDEINNSLRTFLLDIKDQRAVALKAQTKIIEGEVSRDLEQMTTYFELLTSDRYKSRDAVERVRDALRELMRVARLVSAGKCGRCGKERRPDNLEELVKGALIACEGDLLVYEGPGSVEESVDGTLYVDVGPPEAWCCCVKEASDGSQATS